MLEDLNGAGGTRPVSRRALAAGVAWSAPAVWLAAAAPATAASPDYILGFVEAEYSGANGRWNLSVSVQNLTGIKVKVTQIKISAPFGTPKWTFTWTPNTNINANSTATMASASNSGTARSPLKPGAAGGPGPVPPGQSRATARVQPAIP